MSEYHINRDGDPGKCGATVGVCPFGSHYDSVDEAVRAYESMNKVVPKPVKKKTHYQYTNELTNYGVGNARRVFSNSGDLWDKNLRVFLKHCENVPKKREDCFGRGVLQHFREVLVGAEVVGYICSDKDKKRHYFMTVEQANDPCAFPLESYTAGSAIGELVERYKNNEKELFSFDDDGHTFVLGREIEDNEKIINVDDDTKVFLAEKDKFGVLFRSVFLIKKGKPVSYIKTMDEKNDTGETVTVRCDVETRYSERGKGYAGELSRVLEKELNGVLYSNGTFTELGYRVFGSNKNLTGEARRKVVGAGLKPNVPSMNFIIDWDNMKERYPI